MLLLLLLLHYELLGITSCSSSTCSLVD